MRVLITGSEGTIGKPLRAELLDRGHEVFGCDLFHTDKESHEYMRADVSDYREIARVFEEFSPEATFHLAAEFGRHNGNRHFEQVWRTNLIGNSPADAAEKEVARLTSAEIIERKVL